MMTNVELRKIMRQRKKSLYSSNAKIDFDNDIDLTEYEQLLNQLKNNNNRKKYENEMNTEKVPYYIPRAYSLQYEVKKVATMKNRIDNLGRIVCRDDAESMKLDWEKVGKEIGEAINKSRRIGNREPN